MVISARMMQERKHLITGSFAAGDAENGFKVYMRSYCEGTNLGPNAFGLPTGKKLDEINSFGQTIYILKTSGGHGNLPPNTQSEMN
jgi:hypothetical protein